MNDISEQICSIREKDGTTIHFKKKKIILSTDLMISLSLKMHVDSNAGKTNPSICKIKYFDKEVTN